MGHLMDMKKFVIILLLLIFAALTLWGIEGAAAGTHRVLGNADHQSFIGGIL